MPPKAQRPLTSRTQIIRSKRFKSNNSPASPMKVKGYSTNQTSDGQMIVNSNNQVNIHIGSVEINENLEKTPTDQVRINYVVFLLTFSSHRRSIGYGNAFGVHLKSSLYTRGQSRRQRARDSQNFQSLWADRLRVSYSHFLPILFDEHKQRQ